MDKEKKDAVIIGDNNRIVLNGDSSSIEISPNGTDINKKGTAIFANKLEAINYIYGIEEKDKVFICISEVVSDLDNCSKCDFSGRLPNHLFCSRCGTKY